MVAFKQQVGVGVREGIAGTMHDGKMPGGVKQINSLEKNVHTARRPG